MNSPQLLEAPTQPAAAARAMSPRQEAAMRIARAAARLLENENLVLPQARGEVFWVLPLGKRAVLVFDPLALRKPEAVVSPRFTHRLSTALGGVRVVATNHRGVFLQVAYQRAPSVKLESRPLDLSRQPSSVHVPIGITKTGELWLPLPEMDSVLIGGTRRMGKTNLLHTWIQALLLGKQARLFLWDGKGGVEFGRYAGQAIVEDDLAVIVKQLHAEMLRRKALLRQTGYTSIAEYNRHGHLDSLPLLVLVVDELAQVPDDLQDALSRLVAVGGAFGIHPVLATQRPDAQAVQGLLRSNLSTRIALPVPTRHESQIILGRAGAEKLPKKAGRLLLTWNARLIEAQAFRAELSSAPQPARPPVEESPSVLTPREQALIPAIMAQDGWFRVRQVAEATGESRDWVNKVAQRWERMGYLTPVQHDEKGHRLGRKVTPALLQAAGVDQAATAKEGGEM